MSDVATKHLAVVCMTVNLHVPCNDATVLSTVSIKNPNKRAQINGNGCQINAPQVNGPNGRIPTVVTNFSCSLMCYTLW